MSKTAFYFLLLGFFRYVVRPDMSRFSAMADEYVRREAGKMGPMKIEEKITLWVFFGVVMCWMLPGIAGNLLPGVSAYLDRMGYAIPPLVGAILLHLIRVKDQPLLTFRQWMMGVEWGAVAPAAAIMAIGAVIGDPKTGIPQFLTGILQPVVNTPFFVLVLVRVTWVVLQTNVMSNLVSATLVYTILCQRSLPLVWAIRWLWGLRSSLAAILPFVCLRAPRLPQSSPVAAGYL